MPSNNFAIETIISTLQKNPKLFPKTQPIINNLKNIIRQQDYNNSASINLLVRRYFFLNRHGYWSNSKFMVRPTMAFKHVRI